MKVRIAVCDDEKQFRTRISDFAADYMKRKDISYDIDLYASGNEFVEQGIEMAKYQIIFLDINMDNMDGIATAKRIREVDRDIFIVFVTAFINYTLEGYKVDAVRYLLKDNAAFAPAMEECMDAIMQKMKYVLVKREIAFREGKKTVALNRILYVESRLHTLIFHVMEDELREYTLYDTLDRMEGDFSEYHFLRIHQSYLVNLEHLAGLKRYEARLNNGIVLSIPKARYRQVAEAFAEFKGEI